MVFDMHRSLMKPAIVSRLLSLISGVLPSLYVGKLFIPRSRIRKSGREFGTDPFLTPIGLSE
jgi:hypothetical protein